MALSKEHILAEIRRTAQGGKALGRERFFAETGVKESDWSGKYWVRWNDALAEAGFGPNRLNERLLDEQVLDRLAALVRELGHFPVIAEIKIKARSDPQFPSHNTFGRFGDKGQLAARLHRFCVERGLDDVAALCAQPDDKGDEIPIVVEQSQLPDAGFVYLIRAGRFYKIGRTNELGRRERELAIQLPERATVVHSIKTDDPAGIEEYWHRRFHLQRQNGEWFKLTAEDVAAFRRRKFM